MFTIQTIRIARIFRRFSLILILLAAITSAHAQDARPLRVAATVPELGSLVREIGGDQVVVTVFAKPTEDPHFIEARPSYIKAVSEADLFVQLGMDMEIGYASILLGNSRNAAVLTGGRGFVDASVVIEPMDIPAGPINRSMGDVHLAGNPHYLLDPLNGLRVATLLRDKLTDLRPSKKEYFDQRYVDFRNRLGAAMVGEKLAAKYEFGKLALLAEHGKLADFLEAQGEENLLGGWLGAMLPHFGAKFVDEHDLWPYFARRFGLQNVGHMEPVPGIPPTTRHLRTLIEKMQAEQVRLILAVPYYDTRHAQFVADKTGAEVVTLAHQTGAVEGADDYIGMFDANIKALASALGGN